jgi:hypothetical protein
LIFFFWSHTPGERRFSRPLHLFPCDIFSNDPLLTLHIFNFVIPSVSLSLAHVNREIKGTRRAGDTLRIRTENKRWGEHVYIYIYIFSPRVKARLFGSFFFVFRARIAPAQQKEGETSLSPLPFGFVSTRARERERNVPSLILFRQTNFDDANNVWTRERATRNERSDVLDARCDERERVSFCKNCWF